MSMTSTPVPYTPPGLGLLSLTGENSLIVGAIIDFALGLVVITVLNLILHLHLPLVMQVVVAIILGGIKYAWSINFGQNHVPPFQRGIVTRVGALTPSGPDGHGLMPGYYWLPLGFPIFKIAIKESVKEVSVLFENLQVWTKNTEQKGKGSIQGVLDGLAQFYIYDLAAYKAVENPPAVLQGITHEAARDAAEAFTAEEYLATENAELGNDIFEDIVDKLSKRVRSLGIRCISVSVKKTDMENDDVEKSWAQITAQRSLAEARRIDADGRVERIKTYQGVGVDANRAIAADLVADDKSGAAVDDRRFNADVGASLKSVLETLVTKLPGGRP